MNRDNWIVVGLMGLLVAIRWPELLPSNFSPVYAIFFCAGVYFKDARAWLLPVGLMFVSDLVINHFYYRPLGYSVFGFYMLLNYELLLLLVLAGQVMTDRAQPAALVGAGALGAVGFFAVSNGVVWLTDPFYPKTVSGFIQAYTTGKPGLPPTWMFFRNAAMSGALFTGMIVLSVKYFGVKRFCPSNTVAKSDSSY